MELELPHHHLHAYRLSIEWLKLVHATQIRDADQRAQARKSAKSAARNLAEGAGRASRADFGGSAAGSGDSRRSTRTPGVDAA